MKILKNLKSLTILSTALLVSACANTGINANPSDMQISDPYEDMNRKVFAFNVGADKYVIHPIVDGYRAVAPKPARKAVSNILRNLRTPVDLANQLLQLDFEGAGTTLTRAAINTTVGVGGIFDVAEHEGIKYEFEDFGQTLAVWGVPHGPYFMLPLIGPSSMRDYTGYIGDSFMDPMRFYAYNTNNDYIYYTKFGVNYLTIRESLKDVQLDLQKNSIDYYAALRSIYYQKRNTLVKDLSPENIQDNFEIPDYDDTEFDDGY